MYASTSAYVLSIIQYLTSYSKTVSLLNPRTLKVRLPDIHEGSSASDLLHYCELLLFNKYTYRSSQIAHLDLHGCCDHHTKRSPRPIVDCSQRCHSIKDVVDYITTHKLSTNYSRLIWSFTEQLHRNLSTSSLSLLYPPRTLKKNWYRNL